jgi:PTH1 family peptidyl-tRNA hydrolase
LHGAAPAVAVGRFRGRYTEARLDGTRLGLLLPETYMNRSGESVRAALDGLDLGGAEPERRVVAVYDDLDLTFGRLRIRASGGAGGHRGVASLIDGLASEEFSRVRIGVGRPPPDRDPVDHVLEPFSAAEEEALPAVLSNAAAAIACIASEGVVAAMNAFNAATSADASEKDSATESRRD